MSSIPLNIIYLLAFVISLATSLYGVPRVIAIASRKRLFDYPDEIRKTHVNDTPNLGGIGIFFSFIITASLFIAGPITERWGYIICSCSVLFLVGVNDDLLRVSPTKKLLAQVLASVITVYFADVRIHSLFGLFGIFDLAYWPSVLFSIAGCIFIINAYNLADGIDGLAGSFAVLASLLNGLFLVLMHNNGAAVIAFSLTGATFGFLRYNIAPAKVFMGDTGSLLIGYVIAMLSITLVNSYLTDPIMNVVHSPSGAMMLTLSFIFLPVFDCFRVFIARVIKGISPFKADRRHLHHYLVDAGFSQTSSVALLVASNVAIILIVWLAQDLSPLAVLSIMIVAAMLLFSIIYEINRRK